MAALVDGRELIRDGAGPEELLSALQRLTSLLEQVVAGQSGEWLPDGAEGDRGSSEGSDQADVVAALESFVQSHGRYLAAREAVRQAGQALAVSEAERQVCLAELRSVLLGAGQPGGPPSPRRDRADGHGGSPPSASPLPTLEITCFGRFNVRRGGRNLELCANRNGQAILRYLVAQPRRCALMDVLIETLWPDDPPRVARHKLHCAFSSLRRSLNDGIPVEKGGGYVLCENGAYLLNPAAEVRTDADQLLAHYRAGLQANGAAAAKHFEAACRLYAGPFLIEDLYADWPQIRREQLAQAHLAMCAALAEHHLAAGRHDEAAGWAMQVLEENRCDESAFRLLIRAHIAAGRRGEALRQYQLCERVLAEELGVEPMPETRMLLDAALQRERT